MKTKARVPSPWKRALPTLLPLLALSACADTPQGPSVTVGAGDFSHVDPVSDAAGAPPCNTTCGTLECGTDPCGYTCGACGPGSKCSENRCVPDADPCAAKCDGRDCGKDGCGGLCGVCADGTACNAAGQCIATGCQATCETKKCGDDGCGGSCGACGPGFLCSPAGTCVAAGCTPTCVGKTCGGDGCGGSCGGCTGTRVCGPEGHCQEALTCTVGAEGACSGAILTRCVDGVDFAEDCATAGKECRWSGAASRFVCGEPACVPQCANRECGIDGCGGSCGSCGSGTLCSPQQTCIALESGGPCNGVSYEGLCSDELLVYCTKGKLKVEDCAAVAMACKFVTSEGWYDCVEKPCGDVTEVGVCQGDMLLWCDKGSLAGEDCAQTGKKCAFDAGQQWFECL